MVSQPQQVISRSNPAVMAKIRPTISSVRIFFFSVSLPFFVLMVSTAIKTPDLAKAAEPERPASVEAQQDK